MADIALITGASSGIERGVRQQLAARGFELALVARREDRLRELAEKAADTGTSCPATSLRLRICTRRSRSSASRWTCWSTTSASGCAALLRPAGRTPSRRWLRGQLRAVVTLTSAFLPGMLDRNRDGVITVASTAKGVQPLPYEAVYGASKAFALNFTEALHAELRSTDIGVLSVNPGPVPTEWQQVAGYEAVGGEMMPGAIGARPGRGRSAPRIRPRQALAGPRPLLPQLHARQRIRRRGRSSSSLRANVPPEEVSDPVSIERFESPARPASSRKAASSWCRSAA